MVEKSDFILKIESLSSDIAKELSALDAKVAKGFEDSSTDTEDIELAVFWLRFSIAVQKLSQSGTKLSIMYSKAPFPDDSLGRLMIDELIAAKNEMMEMYSKLSTTKGVELNKAVLVAVRSILSALNLYLGVLGDAVLSKQPVEDVSSVGVFLKECDRISELPGDNKVAACKMVKGDEILLKDAFEEIEEEVRKQKSLRKMGVSQGGDVDEVWLDSELKLAEDGVKLAKTVCLAASCALQALVRSGDHDGGPSRNKELDLIAELTSKLSAVQDDLISSIYPPLESLALLATSTDNYEQAVLDYLTKIETAHYMNESDRRLFTNLRTHFMDHLANFRRDLASPDLLDPATLSIHD